MRAFVAPPGGRESLSDGGCNLQFPFLWANRTYLHRKGRKGRFMVSFAIEVKKCLALAEGMQMTVSS